jgi:hypothetical protein
VLSGIELGICTSAIVTVNDCPFDKVEKPDLPLDSEQVTSLWERLLALWEEIRDALGVESAREQMICLALSRQEVICIRECLFGVLQECAGSPLELELRVGMPIDVERLHTHFSNLLTAE